MDPVLQPGQIVPVGLVQTAADRLFGNLAAASGGSLFYRPPLISRNQEVDIAREAVVRQARQTERSSELLRGAIDRKADMVVGPRLRVHPQPDFAFLGIDDKAARKRFILQATSAFNNWAYDDRKLCDAEGHHDFGGLMWMAYRNAEGPDGECGGIIHFEPERRQEYATRWGTFVTVADPDKIETPPQMAGDPNVFKGKRLDRHGRMIGIYFRRQHPGEGGVDYVFVPRETEYGRPLAFHWFTKTRGGQQRGLSNIVTIIRRTDMLNAFDTSYAGAAAINAELATYIKTKSSPQALREGLALAPAPGEVDLYSFDAKVSYYEKAKLRFGRGNQRIAVLAPDDEVKMESVNRAIDDPSPFRHGIIREISSVTGVPFSFTAQNYSEANYSSERASKLDSWLGVKRNRDHFTASPPQLCYSAVLEEAIAIGLVDFDPSWPPFLENRAAYCAAAWTGPAMGWIDPLKEANAYKELLAMKVTSRRRIAAERGDDIFEIFDELASEAEEAEARGIDLAPAAPAAAAPGLAPEPDPTPPETI